MPRYYPKDLYSIDQAVRLHFKDPKFDAVKYRMKIRKVSDDTFERSKGFRIYIKWTDILNKTNIHPINFMLANVLAGETYIHTYNIENHTVWLGKIERVRYNIIKEINACMSDNNIDKFSQLFRIDKTKTDYPIIIDYYLEGKISLETLTIINTFVRFTDKLQIINLGWEDIRQLITKYESFLKKLIDFDKIKKLLLETYKNNTTK